MPESAKKRKYILYSKTEGEDGVKPCSFFFAPEMGGCKNGDNCKFSHTIDPATFMSKPKEKSSSTNKNKQEDGKELAASNQEAAGILGSNSKSSKSKAIEEEKGQLVESTKSDKAKKHSQTYSSSLQSPVATFSDVDTDDALVIQQQKSRIQELQLQLELEQQKMEREIEQRKLNKQQQLQQQVVVPKHQALQQHSKQSEPQMPALIKQQQSKQNPQQQQQQRQQQQLQQQQQQLQQQSKPQQKQTSHQTQEHLQLQQQVARPQNAQQPNQQQLKQQFQQQLHQEQLFPQQRQQFQQPDHLKKQLELPGVQNQHHFQQPTASMPVIIEDSFHQQQLSNVQRLQQQLNANKSPAVDTTPLASFASPGSELGLKPSLNKADKKRRSIDQLDPNSESNIDQYAMKISRSTDQVESRVPSFGSSNSTIGGKIKSKKRSPAIVVPESNGSASEDSESEFLFSAVNTALDKGRTPSFGMSGSPPPVQEPMAFPTVTQQGFNPYGGLEPAFPGQSVLTSPPIAVRPPGLTSTRGTFQQSTFLNQQVAVPIPPPAFPQQHETPSHYQSRPLPHQQQQLPSFLSNQPPVLNLSTIPATGVPFNPAYASLGHESRTTAKKGKNLFANPKLPKQPDENNNSLSNGQNNAAALPTKVLGDFHQTSDVNESDNDEDFSEDEQPQSFFDPSTVDFSALRWADLVPICQSNQRFLKEYVFVKDSSWVKARPASEILHRDKLPSVIALDCEMCETMDPVTGDKIGNALIRLSVINGQDPAEVIIDTLVAPMMPITEPRTFIHGITEQQLVGVQFTLRHAQAVLLKICTEDTIIIGHGLHNDLKALKFEHFNVIDTSYLYLVENAPNALAGARDICEQVLGIKSGDYHDPVEDARIALYIAAKLLVSGPNKPIRKGTEGKYRKELRLRQQSGDFKGFHGSMKQLHKKGKYGKVSSCELLVHRIPDFCTADQIRSMIVAHTNCQPIEVHKVIRPDNANPKDAVGRTTVVFDSEATANQAFAAIAGTIRPDKQGRGQKRIYFKSGGHCCVRSNSFV